MTENKNKKILTERSLHESVKHLDCLYNVVSSILRHEKSIEKIFQAVATHLHQSWQYPDIACGRILFENKEYVSDDFKVSRWKQSSDIFVEGENVGKVEIFYLKKTPDVDEGPFLKEERMLIDTVARHISTACNKIKLESSLKERIKELQCLYGVSNIIERYGSNYKKILKGIVDLLPEAWQFPEITCAKIKFKNEEFKTDNYKNYLWKQIAFIRVDNKIAGFVEVAYTQEMSILDEGPFLREERLLINALAERIGEAIIRIQIEKELEIERIALKNKNTALIEVIDRIQEEKKKIAGSVQANVDKIIMPTFSILEKTSDDKDIRIIKLLKKNLEEVAAPFINAISREFARLSPVEIQVCSYIKNGLSTKEIAQLQGIAISTVSRHRENIRKKLNLTNKKINLVTYLNSFMVESELS